MLAATLLALAPVQDVPFTRDTSCLPPLSSLGFTGRLAVGDADADGFDDLLVNATNVVRLARGGPSGFAPTFVELAKPGTFGGGVLVVDTPGAGRPTIVASRGENLPSGSVSRIEALALDPTGALASNGLLAIVPGSLSELRAADWNGDGLTDVVVLGRDEASDRVFVFTQDAGGALVPSESFRYAGETLLRPRILDADGDGDLDVIGGRYTPGEGIVLLSNDGAPDLTVSSLGGLQGAHTVHPADVDLDGDIDLLFWAKRAFFDGSIGWLPRLPNGGFGAAVEVPLPALPTPYSECTDMAVADFNGDGAVDFVQTQSDVGFAVGSLAVGLNDGTGQFDVTVETLVAYMEDPIVIDVGVPDGDLDLIGRNVCDPVNGGPLNCAVNGRSPFVGTEYCAPAVPNSTGAPGAVQALGSRVVGMNFLRLRATSLPPSEFGFFLGSRGRDDVAVVPSSVGRLCVGGTSPIARFVRPGEVLNSGALGAFELQVDLTDLPVPLVGPVLPGETLYFQAWHRDAATSPGSNFTRAVAVLFVP